MNLFCSRGEFSYRSLNLLAFKRLLMYIQIDLRAYLLTKIRNGIKQRKSSWQDGVLGTNCPIPPKSNWTYKMQMKDQIGTYNYFPSTLLHRAAGGFGGLNILARSIIPVPYAKPYEEFTVLIGDWWKKDHKV